MNAEFIQTTINKNYSFGEVLILNFKYIIVYLITIIYLEMLLQQRILSRILGRDSILKLLWTDLMHNYSCC